MLEDDANTSDVSNKEKPRFSGFIENLNNRQILGWASDRDDEDGIAQIVVLVRNEVLTVIGCTEPRPDVAEKHGRNKKYQYRFNIPDEWAVDADDIRVAVIDPRLASQMAQACDMRNRSINTDPVYFDYTAADPEMYRILPMTHRLARRMTVAAARRRTVQPKPGCTLFEISDLLIYLRSYSTVSGIQRTECGVISALFGAADVDQSDFAFCIASDRPGQLTVLLNEPLHQIVAEVAAKRQGGRPIAQQVDDLIISGMQYEISAGDNLFILGAYWIVPDLERQLQVAKSRGARIGVLIYDIIPIENSQYVDSGTCAVFAEKLPTILSLSDYMISISEYVKTDVARLLDHELCREMPSAVALLPHELTEIPAEAVRPETFIQNQRFVLCVGTLEPRKNHALLYRVWAALLRKHGFTEVPTLVLVGRWGWRMDEFRKNCERSKYLDGKIEVREDIRDDELARLYRSCLFTVFPSFAEGWGLPVGESLSFGKLCIASKETSLPEVGGDLVEYIDPHSYPDAFGKIERAIFDRSYLADRENTIALNFIPRTWAEMVSGLLAKTQSLARAVTMDTAGVAVVPPLFRDGQMYRFDNLAQSDVVSWSYKQARFALTDGWHALEDWGAWSSRPIAHVSFRVGLAPGAAIKVWLRLRLPNLYRGEELGVTCNERPISLMGKGIGTAFHWFAFSGIVDERNCVTLKLCRPRAYAAQEEVRELFIGISGIGFHIDNDPCAERNFLGEIAGILK